MNTKEAFLEVIENPLSRVELENGFYILGADAVNEHRMNAIMLGGKYGQRGVLGKAYLGKTGVESEPIEFDCYEDIDRYFIELG